MVCDGQLHTLHCFIHEGHQLCRMQIADALRWPSTLYTPTSTGRLLRKRDRIDDWSGRCCCWWIDTQHGVQNETRTSARLEWKKLLLIASEWMEKWRNLRVINSDPVRYTARLQCTAGQPSSSWLQIRLSTDWSGQHHQRLLLLFLCGITSQILPVHLNISPHFIRRLNWGEMGDSFITIASASATEWLNASAKTKSFLSSKLYFISCSSSSSSRRRQWKWVPRESGR